MIFTAEYSTKMLFGQAILTAAVGILTVLFILGIIAVLIMLVSKAVRLIEGQLHNEDLPQDNDTPNAPPPLPETESQGKIILEGIDEPTAAVIMAIVSKQSGIPLNKLSFKSIKLLEGKYE